MLRIILKESCLFIWEDRCCCLNYYDKLYKKWKDLNYLLFEITSITYL